MDNEPSDDDEMISEFLQNINDYEPSNDDLIILKEGL